MTALASLKTDSAIELDRDVVSLGGYAKIEMSDIYNMTVELAFLRTANSGALGLELHTKTDGGANFRQTLWMSSGTAKGGNNYYIDKDGKKNYLPGFVAANSLALLTAGKEIGDLETEDKVAKLYDYAQGKEVPTNVQMFTDLVGQPIKAGLLKQIQDKNTQDASGAWVASGETREVFEIDKLFRARDNMTVTEIMAQATEANFYDTWLAKNKDRVVDRSKANKGKANSPVMNAGIAAQPKPATSTASLFG